MFGISSNNERAPSVRVALGPFPLGLSHDGDSRNAAHESVAEWLLLSRADGLYVDGDSPVFGDMKVTACPWWGRPDNTRRACDAAAKRGCG